MSNSTLSKRKRLIVALSPILMILQSQSFLLLPNVARIGHRNRSKSASSKVEKILNNRKRILIDSRRGLSIVDGSTGLSAGNTWILIPKEEQIEDNSHDLQQQLYRGHKDIHINEKIDSLIPQMHSIFESILEIRGKSKGKKIFKRNFKAIPYCRTLVQLLQEHSNPTSNHLNAMKVKEIPGFNETLSHTLSLASVQALRAAADANDYNLICQIIRSSIEFASSYTAFYDVDSKHFRPIIEPRLFGEAIQTLTRTTAGYSKLRQTWQNFKKAILDGICPYPHHAMELNSMIIALKSRKRVRAALNLYHENKHMIQGDAYTASALFNLLIDSIESDIQGYSQGNKSKNCWQLKEALMILNDFEKSYRPEQESNVERLNNHVYTVLLKLNEKVMEWNEQRGYVYNGAAFGISVLERMKKLNISPDTVTCTMIMSTLDKAHQWKAAISLLNLMKKSRSITSPETEPISLTKTDPDWVLPRPNIYTYSAAMSACARANKMELTLDIFNSLKEEEKAYDEEDLDDTHDKYRLERNTWVYNTVLAACSGGSDKGFEIALDLLQKMQEDVNLRGMNTKPNSVTYNTILGILAGGEVGKDVMTKLIDSSNSNDTNNDFVFNESYVDDFISTQEINATLENKVPVEETVVKNILSKMKQQNITRDAITYHNAILASSKSSHKGAIRLLEYVFAGQSSTSTASDKLHPDASLLTSKAKSNIINTAISSCAMHGSIQSMMDVHNQYFSPPIMPDGSTYHIILKGMCKANEGESAFHVLRTLNGNRDSAKHILEKYGIEIHASSEILDERHYFTVIDDCILNDKIQNAIEVLSLMNSHGKFSPSASSLTSIIISCSKKAIEIESKEWKTNAQNKSRRKGKSRRSLDRSVSQSRAKAAMKLLQSINFPQIPPTAASAVSKACAATGLWENTYTLLSEIHESALLKQTNLAYGDRRTVTKDLQSSEQTLLKTLPDLHRYLLNICARDGDVTNALQIVDKIQNFSQELVGVKRERLQNGNGFASSDVLANGYSTNMSTSPSISSLLLSGEDTEMNFTAINKNIAEATSVKVQNFPGLDALEWKLLIIAASKARNWRICLSTIQVLRSYIENTNPNTLSSTSSSDEKNSLAKQYENLSVALSSAIFCFESSKQYAWAIRVVDDWIKWSGRRPPKNAMISLCRLLATNGRGQELKEIISRVMGVNPYPSRLKHSQVQPSYETENFKYEVSIYSYAVHSLYKQGLYDSADEVYLEGVSKGILLWAVMDNEDNLTKDLEIESIISKEDHADLSPLRLDLHGMSLAIAHSAVRTALQKEVQRISLEDNFSPLDDQEWSKDVVIVTGKGINSVERFRPILRPEVQRMLTEEFYPPLSTTSIPNNIGALQIPAKDVDLWLSYQRQQRGAYMLTVADMLKSVTGVSKLKTSILNLGKQQKSGEADYST